ncbi:dentin matrix acidic phosphoprotein 1-like [Metopolophium dirhodum]|uniref:dentin matrix acidic phosphoprotein 1-like n=1 Tax=Metopolophium dirhodum TaxID=44670 RepID=UPI00298FF6F2|nr:dentin matrix acidic phosphoprotein 1-like [Metopolophium dirhodum]
MLASPVDNNVGGSCRGKQNNNQQCSLPHQKSECSVRNVREPILANLQISFDEKPEADFCKNDTCTESNDREATGCSRIAKNDTCSTESNDREATGCSRVAKNDTCGARPREKSRPAKEPTRADASRDDLKNSCRRQPTFDDEQQKGAGSSRRNNEPWTGCESLLQVSTPLEADFCKNDTYTESNDGEATGCSRIAKNGACGARPREESRPAKEPTGADVSRDDLKTSCRRQPTFDDEQQKGAGSSRRNNEPKTGHESLHVSTPTVWPTKDPTTYQKSAPPSTSNNRTLTNRPDGVLQEFEKELLRVEQRRAQLMRCIERKQRALMKESLEVRTSLQNYCEQQSSGGEKQSLHDIRERRPPQKDTTERRPSQYDTRERRPSQYDNTVHRPSQHDTNEHRSSQYGTRVHRPSQYDTTVHRPPQNDTNERRLSQYESRERLSSSHHDTRKRRPSQDDTRKRRPSQDDTRKRRPKRQPSQDDTRKRRPSQHDTRERRPSQDNTRERRSSQYDLRECQPSTLDTRERQSSKGENRKQPQGGSFVFECFCNFIGKDNSFNNKPATKQVSSRHSNNNAYNTTKVEVARKDAASTGRHGGSGRRSTPRNDATATSPDSAEQNRSRQDTFQPRGCPRLRVVDLISFTNNSSVTTIGGTQKHNNRANRGWNETQ